LRNSDGIPRPQENNMAGITSEQLMKDEELGNDKQHYTKPISMRRCDGSGVNRG